MTNDNDTTVNLSENDNNVRDNRRRVSFSNQLSSLALEVGNEHPTEESFTYKPNLQVISYSNNSIMPNFQSQLKTNTY